LARLAALDRFMCMCETMRKAMSEGIDHDNQ